MPSSFVNIHAQQHFDCCNLHLHRAEEISMLRRMMHKIRYVRHIDLIHIFRTLFVPQIKPWAKVGWV